MLQRIALFVSLLVLLTLTALPAAAEPSPDGERVTHPTAADPGFEVKTVQDKVYLPNPKHQYQGWNNCGPTTTAIALSNYGVMRTQTDAVNVLKPNPKDVNVSPNQIVDYVRSQGLDAQMRVNGTIDTLMWFLSNDIPVIVEQWLPEDGGMGHYRLATGYNRERQTMTFDDSYLGPDQRWSWEDWNARWSEYNPNHIFIPVYKPEQAALVRALLGPDASDSQMWQRAEASARQLIQDNPTEGRNWFALGDALLNQNRVDEAYQAYEKGYAVGLPFRYYWYQFGHFEAAAKLGRWQRLIQLSEPVLARAPVHEEMYYYRGLAYQNMGNKAAARDAFMQSLDANRLFARPKVALDSLN